MLLPAALAFALTQLPVDPRAGEHALSSLRLDPAPGGATFSWQDTEESLKGALTPSRARVGQPLTVSASVLPLAGPEYEGPVTFALRPLDEMGSTQTATVTRPAGEKTWVATFTPHIPGEHRLEISWRTTHHKVVRGVVPVQEAGVPPWLNWAVGVGLVTLAVLGGVWSLFRGKESSSP